MLLSLFTTPLRLEGSCAMANSQDPSTSVGIPLRHYDRPRQSYGVIRDSPLTLFYLVLFLERYMTVRKLRFNLPQSK
jgi:hypothetical protein